MSFQILQQGASLQTTDNNSIVYLFNHNRSRDATGHACKILGKVSCGDVYAREVVGMDEDSGLGEVHQFCASIA
ncbi:uncharacterized protein PpBr36_06415 [Pyricularia pennisetigena]|uniref:uncharacterized protein n=1 Tax=Pyricularia pennisetigena TaxID=1578925 RepID=UPI001151590A|nr:uncharacterized protein PpBr36_06415 [Pyricularia pennisetigena]TLS23675.1 hypothetical protein PpBr36_06415 [Pyricularia pennisetigena]